MTNSKELEPESGDRSLESSLQSTWNARVVDYDETRYPFAERIRDEVRRLGFQVDSLDRIHEVVPREQVFALSKDLCAATQGHDFRQLVHEFVNDEIVSKGKLTPPIVTQRFLNVRIMLPEKPQGVFPFHTGLLYGHGPASRSLWLPLTDVSDASDRSASLQIIELDRSRELIEEATQRQLRIDEMTELFGRESKGIKAGPGQVLLFSQEHIHGNFVNETEKTRVSIDFRVAEGCFGDQLARKIPGGYFELVSESSNGAREADSKRLLNGKPSVIYLNNNTSSTQGVPMHLQRYMVNDYCTKNGLDYEFELFELETMDHLPTLMHVIDNLECNALMYSIYALPEAPDHRAHVFESARAKDVFLYFANEGLAFTSERDREEIELILSFAGFGR